MGGLSVVCSYFSLLVESYIISYPSILFLTFRIPQFAHSWIHIGLITEAIEAPAEPFLSPPTLAPCTPREESEEGTDCSITP